MTDSADRLDSWKAIADYLNRDVRTLRRWEQQGLPVRRVPGGRGNSVYAFRTEIDAWLRGRSDGPAEEPMRPAPAQRVGKLGGRYATALATIVVALIAWKVIAPSAARQDLVVKVSPAAIVASNQDGAEQWRYDFGSDLVNGISEVTSPSLIVGGPRPAVFVVSSFFLHKPDEVPLSGILRWFSVDGRLERTFSFNDQWTFAGRQFSEPWAMTDVRVDDSYGRRQIAVAAHHFTWWPSVVTVLDERFQRQGTFVNAGWIESLGWMAPDRLAIAGFNERLDGGMFAALDTHDIDGASPETGSKFMCDDCRSGTPLFYAVFPRSEVNRITGSPFNRARLEAGPNGVRVHTSEMVSEPGVGLSEAVYEFSTTFDLRGATYGDRYWDKHHALELEGKIKHTRAECPERDGPPLVKVWTKERGWQDIRPPR